MAYQRKAPPSKCKVLIHFGQHSVTLDILPTTLIASVKDLAISQLSNRLESGVSYHLTLLDGKSLSVEFIRLQSADESIASSIKSQNTVELRLVESKMGLTREDRGTKLSSPSASSLSSSGLSSASKSSAITPFAASTMIPPGRPRVASKIGKLSAVFSSHASTPPPPNNQTQSLKISRSVVSMPASKATGSVKIPFSEIPVIERPGESPLSAKYAKRSSADSTSSSLEEEEVVEEEKIDFKSIIITQLRDDTQPEWMLASPKLTEEEEVRLREEAKEQEAWLDLSRRSISLEGDDRLLTSVLADQNGLHLSDMPPPPTLARYSVPQFDAQRFSSALASDWSSSSSPSTLTDAYGLALPYGSNRFSNMPVQLNNEGDEAELARLETMAKFFNAKFRNGGDGTTLTDESGSDAPRRAIHLVRISNEEDAVESSVVPVSPSSTGATTEGEDLYKVRTNEVGMEEEENKTTSSAASASSDAISTIEIASPNLIASTYSPQGMNGERKRLVIEKRPYAVRMATKVTSIGAAKSESVLCFRKMSEKVGEYVRESGRREIDFVSSPMAVGPFMRRQRIFPVVLMPAGPQLIKSDMEKSRWCTMCDVNTTPSTLMQALFFLSPDATQNYILRICGTVEYLVDNDRPLVDYSRLRLLIRDRRRLELLCEDRTGARCAQALRQLTLSLSAAHVPPPIIDPFYGLETSLRDFSHLSLLDGHLTLKIHALEHLQFHVLRDYLDLNESSFATLKQTFETTGYLPSSDTGMAFALEFALIYNNALVEADGAIQRTMWKPAPMWVEQIKFPFTWTQLPRELRILMRVLFRKSKTARPYIIGESCSCLFDVFGVLTTGKQAVPIYPISTSPTSTAPSNLMGAAAGMVGAAVNLEKIAFAASESSHTTTSPLNATSTGNGGASLSATGSTFQMYRNMKHSYSSTSPVASVYKSKSIPFLHYEIYEVKSGLLMMHDESPLRPRDVKRLQAVSPIEFLIPEKADEGELYRLSRIHPLYRMNEKEKAMVWKYRYYIHFSSRHSLPLLVKSVHWMNQKMVEELHRLISQWETIDPLIALELLDASFSDTVTRSYAVECLRSFSDEEMVTYMLQIVQALVYFEVYEDSALARLVLERSLRNRTQIGTSFYWHLMGLNTHNDPNIQERVQLYQDAYLAASGSEHASRIQSQHALIYHFRSLSNKAAKLDPKSKMALLDAELNPDLIALSSEVTSPRDPSQTATSITTNNKDFASQSPNASNTNSQPTMTQPTAITSPTSQKKRKWTFSSKGQDKTIKESTSTNSANASSTSVSPNLSTISSNASTNASTLISSNASSNASTNASVILPSSPSPPSSHSSPDQFQAPTFQSFSFLNLPLDPSICTRRILKSKCKFMVSSAAPMWLVFDNADPLASPAPQIFKSGDDLRQDILILQLLRLMDEIWQRDGLELHVSAYGCVATGRGEGFIEVVPDATTTGKIQKEIGGNVVGALKKTPLSLWMQQQHAGNAELLEEAIDNFVSSCAAYCIASYVLGLGDRHADNIMVTKMGNLFHIDFAHILGNIMKFGAYKRERAPFVLTPEFVFVMGDTKSPKYARFVELCLKGYNSLRRHTYLFIRLFQMMLSAGLPQFTDERELGYLYKSLSMGLSEQGAAEKFSKLIDESRKTTTTLVNNFFHNLATATPSSGGSGSGGASSSGSGSGSSSPSRLTRKDTSRTLTSQKSSSSLTKSSSIRLNGK